MHNNNNKWKKRIKFLDKTVQRERDREKMKMILVDFLAAVRKMFLFLRSDLLGKY